MYSYRKHRMPRTRRKTKRGQKFKHSPSAPSNSLRPVLTLHLLNPKPKHKNTPGN